jgi:hypothetical protein
MKETSSPTTISRVEIDNEAFYKIANHDAMRPFFMSIVSDSNHWMFISSNGGLTAGRKNSEYPLFPYYTDDKITESAETTGSKSIFRVSANGQTRLWEPFSIRMEGIYEISRNLYKNLYGNKVLFEEINHDLGLTFQYQWNSSDQYGFVRKSKLINNTDQEINISVLDGIQNIMPSGVGSYTQSQTSNLVDAYKRSELEKASGIGIYALSAIIVDKAEPSEALKANIAWSLGLEHPKYLLSSLQLNNFRRGMALEEEVDVKAEKGAYFINAEIQLSAKAEKSWFIIADVNKNQSAFAKISKAIRETDQLVTLINEDIQAGTKHLIELNAASDGLQLSDDKYRDARHFSNTLFNIMRGGIFDNNYQIEKWDFTDYLSKANSEVFKNTERIWSQLPEIFSLKELQGIAEQSDDTHFRRLCQEYMPLKFSRRHGDPSRPWNKFSINTRNENDGSKILDYEGNWRDIFQNWEALAHSYPEFVESMIQKFLNASTFDGYNPYRVTKGGIDWETIEPDDPWSYIGYWGDHQIIYLLKFLEFLQKHNPGRLQEYFDSPIFVYANVPYKIKPYQEILKNPKDTIDFDEESDEKIRHQRAVLGADGALLKNENGTIIQVNFIEKMLATVLAKVSNFIPEGGIWMNTQRPEWNDANNALVGNGVSMVTLYYLRRFLTFFEGVFENSEIEEISLSQELLLFFERVVATLEKHQHLLSNDINDKDRKLILDGLGQAGSDYRLFIYQNAFSGKKASVFLDDIRRFVKLTLQFAEHSIKANKREDNLYHAYNLMTIENEEEVSIGYLSEMLEGQVAVLSSGFLSSRQALELLDALKNSSLFRPDQYSYLLYPNKDLPGFRAKNNIPEAAVAKSSLLARLVDDGNLQIIEKDINGVYHFNGNFKNASDLEAALETLAHDSDYQPLVDHDKNQVLQIFEEVFNHKAFTGRSGTFFGYEGLGSIYWHMVSKLLLAVQECCLKAFEEKESEEVIGRLLEHYYEINEGIGVHKPPTLYGAFPTDPYSHTPAGKGAQQPGMTGQVKEDILSRFGELGVFVENGQLLFNPCLLRKDEFLESPQTFTYVNVAQEHKELQLKQGSLCFTYCQVPIVYRIAEKPGIEVIFNDKQTKQFDGHLLDEETSQQVFERTEEISHMIIRIKESDLR